MLNTGLESAFSEIDHNFTTMHAQHLKLKKIEEKMVKFANVMGEYKVPCHGLMAWGACQKGRLLAGLRKK